MALKNYVGSLGKLSLAQEEQIARYQRMINDIQSTPLSSIETGAESELWLDQTPEGQAMINFLARSIYDVRRQ